MSDDDLRVGILGGSTERMLDQLRTADGRWYVPDVAPVELPPDLDPGPTTMAVVDTGVCLEHPLLRDRVIDQVDVTGSGVEDRHGHGTTVAAIIAATTPSVRIISVKALDDDGQGTIPTLCLGLREAARRLGPGGTINLSAGRRDPSCRGTCALCATVTDLQDTQNALVVCAAGNEPGVTYCPAQVGIAVSTDAPWAAPGDVSVPAPMWVLAADG
jgi:subtilisin family serine protease